MSLLSSLWPYLAAAVGGLLVLWRVYAAGKNSEKAKVIKQRIEAIKVSDQVDNDIGAMPPDAKRKELGKWSPK